MRQLRTRTSAAIEKKKERERKKRTLESFRNERPKDSKGIRVSTDTLVHAGSRQWPIRDFVPTVVGDADSAGDSLCWFRGGRLEEERSRKRNETRGSQDGRGERCAPSGPYNMPNADNSTVWSRMSADILSHEWPRRRAPGPAKRDSNHSYILATTCTTTTTATSRTDHLRLVRSQKR